MGSETYSWVIDGIVGGMSQPGTVMPVDDDLVRLRDRYGIRVVVSLTESGLDGSTVQGFGLSYVHLPVADFTPPSQDALDRVAELATRATRTGEAVAVHCAAGLGRTGTVLAAAMVGVDGLSADEAIASVRRSRPGSIETPAQESAVHEYSMRLRGAA